MKNKTTIFNKMKSSVPAIITVLLLVLLFSAGCEKVIDVDLNEAAPALVIQGNLSSDQKVVEVRLTRTTSYFDTLSVTKVSGASISLVDSSGKKIFLHETLKGVYAAFGLNPVFNSQYKLYVQADNQSYESVSTLNYPVIIDSITWKYDEGNSFFDGGYYLNIWFFDPPEIENYYKLQVYRNGLIKNSTDDLIVFNDRYVNGNKVEVSLFNDPYYLNDTIMVQLISIDEKVYDYYKTLNEVINTNPGSAAPANPNSNISNGALGYFSAWSSDTLTAIIR